KDQDPDNQTLHFIMGKHENNTNIPSEPNRKNIQNQLNEIEESVESNQFWENWNTLNKSMKDDLAIQNGDIWTNHLFSKLNNNPDQNK
ncbi:hypothetical protein DVA81_18390, partial [Acinetobacter baumannii]